jgi:hypothetical protein
LSTSDYQAVPVTCPNCQNRFVSPVLSLIDTGQAPEAKSIFLSGQSNVAVCPQCGHAGMLSLPQVYHDPEKELLFTYVPPELNLSESEQQKIIGDLTNRVMSSLPPEQRKGYLLRPRSFLTLDSMVQAVLEAEGITPEMVQAQQKKASLLERLILTAEDEARQSIAQENDDLIDHEFFQLLTLNLQMAQAQEQQQVVQQLAVLREQLLDWTKGGREIAEQEEAIRELGGQISREELLEKLIDAAKADQETRIETMVTVARPVIDYVFYQQLTERIEAAQDTDKTQEVETLKALRQRILDTTAQIDAEMQKAAAEAGQLLERIVQSDDVEKAVRDNLPHIDELFLNILVSNIQAAEQSGRTEVAQKLQRIGDILMELIQESQPPQIRLINELLAAEYPQGSLALLEDNRELLNEEFVQIMQMVAEDLQQGKRQELASRLAQVKLQVTAMLEQ